MPASEGMETHRHETPAFACLLKQQLKQLDLS
jgi:hypothetical protein